MKTRDKSTAHYNGIITLSLYTWFLREKHLTYVSSPQSHDLPGMEQNLSLLGALPPCFHHFKLPSILRVQPLSANKDKTTNILQSGLTVSAPPYLALEFAGLSPPSPRQS